jgi:large subunit ribosomal protein L29
MKTAEIRELSTKELQERIDNEKRFLKKLKLNHAISPLDNPQKIKISRKTVARLMTEVKKRELESQKANPNA